MRVGKKRERFVARGTGASGVWPGISDFAGANVNKRTFRTLRTETNRLSHDSR